MQAHILAIETSSSLCGLALLSRTDQGTQIWTQEHEGSGEHAERILPMAQALLEQAGLQAQDLSAIAFGQGPGGFTGLRVACGIAQGMAYALDIPVLPISTLLAAAWCDTRDVCLGDAHWQLVLQDARMQEVYAGLYCYHSAQGWQSKLGPMLLDADQVPDWLRAHAVTWVGANASLRVSGDALSAFEGLASSLQQIEQVRCGQALKASAAAVAWLALQDWDQGKRTAAEQAAPVYVRDKVAFTIQERQVGRSGNPSAQDQAPHIVPMTLDHLAAVLAIEQAVQPMPWTERNFRDALDAAYLACVILEQGQVQGFAVYLAAPDVLQLLLISVLPGQQGKGFGKMLLEQGEQYARQQGLPAVMLEVRVGNPQAIRFYQRAGYEQLGHRKNYYQLPEGGREDALIMQKTITANEARS